MTRRFYSGVGSRKLPWRLHGMLTNVARVLEFNGFVLRSGAAYGSDAAFESGVRDPANCEIYLPEPGWRGHTSPLHEIDDTAFAMAAKYHPAWRKLTRFARRLHARNCYQVLGRDLATPSMFVVCWTPGGREIGGTAQAIRIASAHDIPVFNLHDGDALLRLTTHLRERGITLQKP